jgi:hypothetical protein
MGAAASSSAGANLANENVRAILDNTYDKYQ